MGHIMLNVSDVEASVAFYCRVLGLREVGRNARQGMVFLSFGSNDHDLVLRQAASGARRYEDAAVGLRQAAFHVAGGLDELRAFRDHLVACGVSIRRIHEHVAITSIYFTDPDGIELEAYMEHPPEGWRARQALRFSRPVSLE